MGEFLRDRLPNPISYFESEGLALIGNGKRLVNVLMKERDEKFKQASRE